MELNGVVGHLEMPEGPDRYDYNPSPHGHLLCDGCGNLADLPVVGLMREVEAAIGTEVCGYTLTIHYRDKTEVTDVYQLYTENVE